MKKNNKMRLAEYIETLTGVKVRETLSIAMLCFLDSAICFTLDRILLIAIVGLS